MAAPQPKTLLEIFTGLNLATSPDTMKDTSRLPTIACGVTLHLLKDWNKCITHIAYKRGKYGLKQPYCAGRISQNIDDTGAVKAWSVYHLSGDGRSQSDWPADIMISCPDCLAIYQDHMQDYNQQ